MRNSSITLKLGPEVLKWRQKRIRMQDFLARATASTMVTLKALKSIWINKIENSLLF